LRLGVKIDSNPVFLYLQFSALNMKQKTLHHKYNRRVPMYPLSSIG
jgi:hypothetical protein